MGVLGNKLSKSETEYKWKQNRIYIEEGFLKSEGVINTISVPLKHTETVTYSIEDLHLSLGTDLKIIGKGTVLATLKIGLDLMDDVQICILEKIE